MSRRIRSVLSCCALLVAFPATGRAFSDPTRFMEPTTAGGGDNRWFTNSPADGFGCNVCHRGAEGLELTVRAIPEVYQPGQTYEIVVSWPNPLAHVAANLEVTDELGQKIGQLSVPDRDQLQPADECEPKGGGFGAGFLFDLPDGRQLLGFNDCGASQVRMQWTAPPMAVGPAFFSGGLVVSNEADDFEGDGVTLLSRVILAPGQDAIDTRASGGCSVRAAARGDAGRTTGLLLGACMLLFSRRRRRRA